MILERVGMLAVDSSRTRAYLDALQRHGLIPSYAVLLAGSSPPALPAVPYFDNLTPATETLRALGVPSVAAFTTDVNSPEVVELVRASPVDVLIYSGPGGAIVGRDLFQTGKRFLHVHPGLVPQFRGSTTVYYSLLEENRCGASAIFLDEGIDCGPLLATREYPPPHDRTLLDHGYDPHIRADLLVRVLQDYVADGEFRFTTQPVGEGETYYIMHPVLRHVAILSRRQTSGLLAA